MKDAREELPGPGPGAYAELVIDWLGSAGLSSVVRGNHDKVVAGIEEPDAAVHEALLAVLRNLAGLA